MNIKNMFMNISNMFDSVLRYIIYIWGLNAWSLLTDVDI